MWGFVGWQYGIFTIMAIFAVFVKDVPYDVSIQLKRQTFITSKVIDQVRGRRPPPQNVAQFVPILLAPGEAEKGRSTSFTLSLDYVCKGRLNKYTGLFYGLCTSNDKKK